MKSIVTAVALFAATPAFAHHNGYINPTTGQREYTDDNYEYRGWSGGWRSSRKCYEKKYKEVYQNLLIHDFELQDYIFHQVLSFVLFL